MNSSAKTNLIDFLFKKGILDISTSGNFPAQGLPLETPIFVNYQKMIQPDNASYLANVLKAQIPPGTTTVAGSNFGQLIAYETAKAANLGVVPIHRDSRGSLKGFVDSKPMKGKKILYINDVLTMGENTGDAMNLIKETGGTCVSITSIFDFGFHLTDKSCKMIPLNSLITLDDIMLQKDESGIISEWKTNNVRFFGDSNRFKEEEPVSA